MSLWQEKLYPILPIFAQNLAISAYGYNWHRRRFGGIYKEELSKFKKREFYTKQQWRDYQTIELRKLLCHAFEVVPFYREKYSTAGFSLSDFNKFELEDLPNLPFLSKDDLRSYGNNSLISIKPEKNGQFFSSSGSTGTPTQIYYSHTFHQRMNAAMESRVRNWAGIISNDARGMIGGRRIIPDAKNNPPFYRYNIFEKQTYFSAYHISPANVDNYLKGIIKHKVKYMTGYAKSNFFLASFIKEIGYDAPNLKAVITSSEKLTPQMRSIFKEVYGCRTFDSYSGVENCGLISENPEGELLVSPDVGIMEVLDEAGNPVAPGEEGEVVSTGLLNYDQPLIRYRIGDRVKLAQSNNTVSGTEMPIIAEISGRIEDFIVTEDGRKMVRFHGIFVNLPHVLEGQIIQHSYEKFTVNIVATKGFSKEEEAKIIHRMKSQLGENVIIIVQHLNEIPRTANGKFKAVISELQS